MNNNQNQNDNNGNYNNNNNNGGNQTVTAADIPMMLKARYFASGVVVGVFISPLVKKSLAKVQPKLDALLDSVTGQAESLMEKGSDLMAKARNAVKSEEGTKAVEKDLAHEGPSAHTH